MLSRDVDPREEQDEAGSDGAVYDRYLDDALAGRAEPPEVFLARHPGAGQALHDRIAALHRMLADEPRPKDDRREEPADDGLPFDRLGEFRLLRRIDQGGMGTIYLAEQESLARTVALKVVRPELQGSPTAATRFRREALAVARLRHENVVSVHAVGEDRGVRWIAMEYVPGRGLDEVLADAAARGQHVAASEAVRWAARIARALDAAHRAGIVHRDVKPSNVRITPDGKPMLLDFGISRELGVDGLTGSAPFVGSPAYAAPEQIAGDEGAADARTDVHALGVVLYECLTGRTPWRGATVEQIFHAILSDEPARLRTLVPALSRDLEVVVAKAVEKDPARRYASAADFADDLEALLDFRPVRARPATLSHRMWRWSRRRPGRAAAGATVAVALLGVAVLLFAQGVAAAASRREDARGAVREAMARIAAYRERRAASLVVERQVAELRQRRASYYLTPEEDSVLEANEDVIAGLRRERESVVHGVLDLLRRAEALDPDVAGTGTARAELHLERWHEAMELRDTAAAAFYRARVLESDPSGPAAETVSGDGAIVVDSDPPGAEVHVFRYLEQAELMPGGDRRLVPVPVGWTPPAPPGTWALEVTTDSGGLRRGDLVLALDGTPVQDLAPARARDLAAAGGHVGRVVHEGRERSADLSPGLAVRVTAVPLFVAPDTLRGRTPLRIDRLAPGAYVVLLRADGREDARVPVWVVRAGTASARATLLPLGETPPGFVRVVPGTGADASWIMEREVLASEYLEFLNDETTLAEIAASPRPIRHPRGVESPLKGGWWVRGEDGRSALSADWRPDWPVLGVSLDDAPAYARWITARSRAAGRDLEHALPTREEWVCAAGSALDRRYVFGDHYRPKWMKCCFARPQASPEPVLSYPVDESVHGVFDLSGSAFEWCESWYDEGRGLWRLAGGAWARGAPGELGVWAAIGAPADFTSGETGFRLVIRDAREPR